MFPMVIDQRYTLEPSLQLYRASRSAFKAATRGQKPRQTSQSSPLAAPPPAYTPTIDTNVPKPSRKATSGSTATVSSASSTSSTSSKRSKLSRFNPFRRRKSNSSTTSSPTESLSPTTTNSAASSTTQRRTRPSGHQSRVRFADDYDSDASSVYSTDFSPEERRPGQSNRRRRNQSEASRNAGLMSYPRDVDENMHAAYTAHWGYMFPF